MLVIFFKLLRATFLSNKVLSGLNVAGLAIGICCSLLIFLWVADELSFDRQYTHAENIYRIIKIEHLGQGENLSVFTPAPLGEELEKAYPQIIRSASIYGGQNTYSFRYNDKLIKFKMGHVTPDIFEMFDFPVVSSYADKLFKNERSAVISKACAEKLFGTLDPIGQFIENTFYHQTFEVSAVVDIPANTHLQFDVMVLFAESGTLNNLRSSWKTLEVVHYVQTDKNSRFGRQEIKQLQHYLSKHLNTTDQLYFQPLWDIHLFTDFGDDWVTNNGHIRYVRIFSTAAFFILIVSGLNYIVLSTARSEKRNKEIALKKLFGLNNSGLVIQFLAETILVTLFAQLLAILIFSLIRQPFGEFTGKSLQLFFNGSTALYFLATLLIIGILSGAYLAFYLSAFKPVSLLRGQWLDGMRLSITKVVVPLQLVISFVFVISSLMIFKQLNFMQNKDKGLQLENIVAVKTQGFIYNFESIKQELLKNANIYSVTASGAPPLDYHFEKNDIDWEGKTDNEKVSFGFMIVDPSFIETFGISMVQGSFLPESMNMNAHFSGNYLGKTPIIINETACSLLGFDDPIGKKMNLGYPGADGSIVGVVKDFNFKPLNYKVTPAAMIYDPESFLEMFIRINPDNKQDVISYIEEVTEPYRKGKYLFDYYFLEEKMDMVYKVEKRMLDSAMIFAIIAVLLSSVGLIGMITYSISRKRKIITIRKVFGASVSVIISLFIREVMLITMIAFLLSIVITIIYLNEWLQSYAYRVELSPLLFFEVLVVSMVIIGVISYTLVHKEANRNPVDNLNYE